MPRPPDRHSPAPRIRNPRLRTTTKCRTRTHQMDVHSRQGSHQNGPRLSPPIGYPLPHTQGVIISDGLVPAVRPPTRTAAPRLVRDGLDYVVMFGQQMLLTAA